MNIRAGTPPRRTQEERSASTRRRLLDATIDCLVDLGHAGTTTTEIVRRAGVSRGAQVHHFPTKAELVQQAVVHLVHRRREELREEFERLQANGDRVSLAIDLLWSAYTGPLFAAALELIVAARTDPELRPVLGTLQDDIRSGIEGFCREHFGTRSTRRRQFLDGLELTIDVMHGMALVRMLDGKQSNDARMLGSWKRLIRPWLEGSLRDRH